MSDTVETVQVKAWADGQGDGVEINAADFDPAIHQLIGGAPAAEKPAKGRSKPHPASVDSPRQAETAGDPPLTRREIEADLAGHGVEFDPTAPLADLRAMRDAARAAG